MAIDLSGVRAILFDAVGTVIYADPRVEVAYRQAAASLGVDVPAELLTQRLADAMCHSARPDMRTSEMDERAFWRKVVGHAFAGLTDDADGLFRHLWEHFANPSSWRVYEDVEPAWQWLRHAGYRLGLASNFDARLATVARQLPPLDQASDVFTSAAIGFRKPDARFFKAIERELGIGPQACLLVGDQLEMDIAGATRAGWRTVWIHREGTRKATPQDPIVPTHEITSLVELTK